VGTSGERLASIPGVVPSPMAMPTGCRFHPRCPYATPECERAPIELTTVSDRHRARCIRVAELTLEGAQ
jgi:oligopeptide/dipeptide ABC transporter ATP-binding protein